MRATILSILILIALLSASGCSLVAGPLSQAPGPVVAIEETVEPVEKVSVADCAAPADETHQLIYAAVGVCFLYPAQYDVTQTGDQSGITLYRQSLLNSEAPSLSLTVESAAGRTLEDISAQRLVNFALPAGHSQTIVFAGQPAILLDNLPGQDTNRRVIVIHNDLVYDLSIARIGEDYGEVGEQAEALYALVAGSFRFIGVEPGAPLLAGPECPTPRVGTSLYTNTKGGFCMLLPDGYAVDDSLTSDDGGSETAIYVNSPLDAAHARLFVVVREAQGRNLEEITTSLRADLEKAFPEYEVAGSFGHMLDGAFANQFNQVPGQDLSRQVVFVHHDRYYTLTFIPDDPAAGDAYTEMEILYALVMDSFSFLWQN